MNPIKGRIPAAHQRKLKTLARLEGTTVAALVRALLTQYATRHQH